MTKTAAGNITQFFYDEQGHLTGKYDASGQPSQEIIWLGDLPVAVLKPATSASATTDIYYIHADHLGTPRKITRPGDNRVVWSWESEAFGNSLPNQNPSGLGNFVFNLRFPGQYYDKETGLFYNYFRDYDPKTGRYIESDPIGLHGGINTYAYVGSNPVNFIDPLGLTQTDIDIALELAKETQKDMKFPDQYGCRDLGYYKTRDGKKRRITGMTLPRDKDGKGGGTVLDDFYQQKLRDDQAAELLDTIIHEADHFTQPINDPKQRDDNGTGHAYDEAARRTTKELINELNKRRKN